MLRKAPSPLPKKTKKPLKVKKTKKTQKPPKVKKIQKPKNQANPETPKIHSCNHPCIHLSIHPSMEIQEKNSKSEPIKTPKVSQRILQTFSSLNASV